MFVINVYSVTGVPWLVWYVLMYQIPRWNSFVGLAFATLFIFFFTCFVILSRSYWVHYDRSLVSALWVVFDLLNLEFR